MKGSITSTEGGLIRGNALTNPDKMYSYLTSLDVTKSPMLSSSVAIGKYELHDQILETVIMLGSEAALNRYSTTINIQFAHKAACKEKGREFFHMSAISMFT